MSRVSIQQFRSRLAVPRAGDGPLVRAYRELSRRPDVAAGARMDGWIPWGVAASTDAPRVAAGWAEWAAVSAKG
ncbi:hypothetical protein [Longimicrobium sp.]|uniref:hypothetical protein n=1 Tax=Longimicrobium sp. TaxID=2029185 RepID=UPI003B3B504B